MRSMGFKSGFDLEFCIFDDLADRSVVAFNITDGDGLPHCMAVGGRGCVTADLAVDEDWLQSHQNDGRVFDTQQYAAAVYARRRGRDGRRMSRLDIVNVA